MSNDVFNKTRPTSQTVFDAFNSFIFSEDTRVFSKMVKRIELYHQVKDLVGDIIEFGVFKGAGMALFLKLKMMYEPNSLTKVIGFDYFNRDDIINSLDGLNKEMMATITDRVDTNDLLVESVNNKLLFLNTDNYILVPGEAVTQCKKFDSENPGIRIKFLYMDLDLGEPTYEVMKLLWNKVVKNGLIVFDEYAYHKWDESNGVDKFLKEVEGQYEFFSTKVPGPSAYIKKLVL